MDATATVTLDPSVGKVTKSHLELKAQIPGISEEEFSKIANKAKAECPISQLLNAEITLNASLS
jgi:osmotically inducible protein OsmC